MSVMYFQDTGLRCKAPSKFQGVELPPVGSLKAMELLIPCPDGQDVGVQITLLITVQSIVQRKVAPGQCNQTFKSLQEYRSQTCTQARHHDCASPSEAGALHRIAPAVCRPILPLLVPIRVLQRAVSRRCAGPSVPLPSRCRVPRFAFETATFRKVLLSPEVNTCPFVRVIGPLSHILHRRAYDQFLLQPRHEDLNFTILKYALNL